MSISKGELLDFANGIKELIVENGRLKHKNESSAEYIKLLEEENRKLKLEFQGFGVMYIICGFG